MSDITIAIGTMLAISAATGLAVAKSKQPEGQLRVGAMAILLFGAFGNMYYSAGKIFWAKYFPHSAVIVWSNFVPIAAAVAAGLAFRLPKTPRWRQITSSCLLASIAVGAAFWPIIGAVFRPAPPGGDTWIRQVALQTSRSSCSPAAAATLLRAHDVDVNEGDLVPLCLSDDRGTVSLGLYRGLKLYADKNNLDVEIISRSLTELYEQDEWPVLLMVELPEYGVKDPRYQRDWGWIPGLGHSVVAFGRLPGGYLLVGDPSIGMEQWRETDLQVLWHGDGIRLRKRDLSK